MKQNDTLFKKYAIFSFLFLLVFYGGLQIWDLIQLPFSNPWGVTGPLTILEFNPANNLVRFVVLISLPTLSLIGMFLINIKKTNSFLFNPREYRFYRNNYTISIRDFMLIMLFLGLAILTSLNIPTCCHFLGSSIVDTFHEGESLGPATAYLHGQAPYRDFIIMHGAFENPLRSILAFSFFGRSIGAARALQSIMAVIALVLLFINIIQIFKFSWLSTIIAITILSSLLMRELVADVNLITLIPIVVPPRNITAHLFLIFIPIIQSYLNSSCERISKWKFSAVIFIFSFVPIAAFAYSIDRGFYLMASFLILSPVIYFLFYSKSVLSKYYVFSSSSGLIAGFLVLGLALRWEYGAFFEFVFLIMPLYKELMDGFVYPIEQFPFMFIVMLSAFNLFWIMNMLLQEVKLHEGNHLIAVREFMRKYYTEIVLLILSIFFFRSGLGRAFWAQVAYSSLFPFLLSIIIMLKHGLGKVISSIEAKKIVAPIVGILLILMISIETYRLIDNDVIEAKFPIGVPDFAFIPDTHEATIRFLQRNLESDEYFFTMTSEPIWYYFLDRPSPSRFMAVWFGMPYFFQEEIVSDLKNKDVPFIIYRSSHWTNSIDGFPSSERLPILTQFIHENYKKYIILGDHEIWRRQD